MLGQAKTLLVFLLQVGQESQLLFLNDEQQVNRNIVATKSNNTLYLYFIKDFIVDNCLWIPRTIV